MAQSPLDMESLLLPTHVLQVIGRIHRLAYAFIDQNLRIRLASDNFASVLSEPDGEFRNRQLSDVLWEFAGAENELTAILQGRLPYLAFERVNRRYPHGQIVYLDLNVTGINDFTLGKGLLLIIEDVTHTAETEQRLTQNRNELALTEEKLDRINQELQRLDQLKSLFLSMAAHDLRGPLTLIRMYSEMIETLLAPGANERVEDILQQIHMQTNWLEWLINDLLDLDQIEQGTLKLHLKTHDLNVVVNEVTVPFTWLAKLRKVTLRVNLLPDPLWLTIDSVRMQQVVYNLLNNAVKYTPASGDVELITYLEGKTAVLKIKDTGVGISREGQAQAFQLFYRGSSATNSDRSENISTHSKGLGLFIVKMLVEAHGGRVKLESEPKKGTNVTVYLPIGTN